MSTWRFDNSNNKENLKIYQKKLQAVEIFLQNLSLDLLFTNKKFQPLSVHVTYSSM